MDGRKEKEIPYDELILRDQEMITRVEVQHLLGYLVESMDKVTEVLDDKNYEYAKSYLSYEMALELVDVICKEWNITAATLYQQLSFPLDLKENSNLGMLTIEFLEAYEVILSNLPEGTSNIGMKSLLVVGKEEADSSMVITDQGNFTMGNIRNYEEFYEDGRLSQKDNPEDNTKDSNVVENTKQLTKDMNFSTLVDSKILVWVAGDEIISIKDILLEETVLKNVWITQGKNRTINTFFNDVAHTFTAKYDLSSEVQGKIGDITIYNKEIIKISIKPDVISGKVLSATKDFIEVKGYGKIPLEDTYKIYKLYDELSMEVTNSILVGYKTTDFVIADGKVAAALIKEKIKAKNIRVLIKTNQFTSIFHDEVKVTADRSFTVTIGEEVTTYKAGEQVTILYQDHVEQDDRIFIKTGTENGKITILSLERSGGNPSYRGTMEIGTTTKGLVLVNELSIEEYLYAVLPSEMPKSYGLTALEVQAICARSYAYQQLFSNGYQEFGAHIDDSVNYQVYNNQPENEDAILAVKETYGKVITYGEEVITAYYFSTSCGHTASSFEVWGNSSKSDYLVGKIQSTTKDIVETISEGDSKKENQNRTRDVDFSVEDDFENFLLNSTETTFDSNAPWYRWEVILSSEEIEASIDQYIASRYQANSGMILTLVDGTWKKNPVYESIPIETIGTLKNIQVGKREKSGILSELIFIGSKATVKIITEYNIRTLLTPINSEIIRQNSTTTSGLSMLPSAFFVFDKKGDSYTFYGGGFGHGVGMSQNGVKEMAVEGYDYEAIIQHYYNGVSLGFIY